MIEAEALTSTDASLPDGFGARLVAVADRERRRLERDLHDGAQQRLVSLSLRLRLLSAQLAPGSEPAQLLEDARNELAESLKELREFARGVHPAILSDHGLPAALDALATRVGAGRAQRRAPAPPSRGRRGCRLLPRLRGDHQRRQVRAGGDCARVGRAARSPAHRGDRRRWRRRCGPRRRLRLRGLMDRVEALGGRLDITSPYAAGTTIRAELRI